MALTPERKAQFDAILGAQGGAIQQQAQGLTPDKKAQFDAILGGGQMPQAPVAQQPTKNNFLSQIFKPIGKTIATGGAALGAAGQLAQGNIAGAQEALTRERKTGLGTFRPVGIDETGQEKSFGGQVKDIIGTGAGVGAFLSPSSIAGTGVKALARGGAVAGALGSGGEALQNDKSLGQIAGSTLGGAALGGALGAGIPLAGKAAGALVKPVTRGAGKVGAEVLGRTTGAGAEAIEQAFNNPNVIKFARQAGKEGPEGLMNQALNEARESIELMTSGNSKAYRDAMSRIKASPKDLTNAVSSIRSNVVKDATEGFGIRFTDGKKLNNLDFNASDIVEGTASVQRAFDRMFGEPISTVDDLDRLKRSLGRIAEGAPARSPAQALIYKMKDSASKVLKEEIPGYAQEMSRFSAAADIADEIRKALSLGDKASIDTTVRKLMSTMRQNNELRKDMLSLLGQKTGKDILGKIAGATLAARTPRGLAGTIAPTATSIGGANAVINPQTIPALLMYLAASSPRLVAEAISLLGKVKGNIIPPGVKNGLKNLIIQASNEIQP